MDDEVDPGSGELLGWAVAANVAQQTSPGPDGEEPRKGLRHFTAGSKVWILPVLWGDGWEDVLLVGRHRGSRRYVQMVVPLRNLENFRVEGVYRPAVMRQLTKPFDGRPNPPRQWSSAAEALAAIEEHPTTRDRLKRA